MAPQKKIFKKAWNEENGTVTLSTDEGSKREFRLDDLSPDIRRKLELHGLTQKLSDATAKEAGTSIGEKWEAIESVWMTLASGEWSMKREGQGTLLLRALCEAYPSRTRDDLKTWLDARSAAERTALTRSERLKPIIDRMIAERSTDIDTDAMLDELE